MEEDLKDASDFVQEDDSMDEQEELLQAKIQEEHAKFKEEQKRWQAHVRATRPWSAPPLSSPRPESQRVKKNEALELARSPAAMLLASHPREVYVPPPRTHLLGQASQGDNNRPASADMAHLGPPRPASADTPRSSSRLLHSSGLMTIKHSGLADIQEESPLLTQPDAHIGQGCAVHAARPESLNSQEDSSSHNTSSTASPTQPEGSNSSRQQNSQALAASVALSPSTAGTQQEVKRNLDSRLLKLAHEAPAISSDGGSGDDEGDEDLFCLFDQESQALKDNLDAYIAAASKVHDDPQAATGAPRGEPLDVHVHSPAAQPAASAALPEGLHAAAKHGSKEAVHELAAPRAEPLDKNAAHGAAPSEVPKDNGAEQGLSAGHSSQEDSQHSQEDGAEDLSKQGDGELGPGSLLPPHQFALHLMAHDLRTLPTHLGSSSPLSPAQMVPPRTHSHSAPVTPLLPPSQQPHRPPSPRSIAVAAAAGAAAAAAAATAAGAAGSPFSPLPHRADAGPRLYLGGHHSTFPPPSTPASHGSYQNMHCRRAASGKGHQARARPSSPGPPAPESGAARYKRAWDCWSSTQLRQHLGLSSRPQSAAAANRARPVQAPRSVHALSRPCSAAAAGAEWQREAPAGGGAHAAPCHGIHGGGPCSPDSERYSPPVGSPEHGQGEGAGVQAWGQADAAAGQGAGSEDSSIRQEGPSARGSVGAPPWLASSSGSAEENAATVVAPGQVPPAPGSSSNPVRHALKYEEWFAQMMGAATNAEGDAPSSKPAAPGQEGEGGQPQGQGMSGTISTIAASSIAADADWPAGSPPGAASQSSYGGPNRQRLGAHSRSAAQAFRPATAPSARQASRQACPYSPQVPGMPHAGTGPPPFMLCHSSGPSASSWEARPEPPVPTRPASAYARLKGAGTGTAPVPAHYPSYGEPALAWELATPVFTPAAAPPMPQKVDATAAVTVGEATVSVYVEDTVRRIAEANRWMAGLELHSRYRLRSRLSNMTVQVYDSTWQPPALDDDLGEQTLPCDPEEAAALAAPTTKELTIKQFLALHLRLKAKAAEAGVARVAALGGCMPLPGVKGNSAAACSGAAVATSFPRQPFMRPKSAVSGSKSGAWSAPPRQRPVSAHAPGGARAAGQRPLHYVFPGSRAKQASGTDGAMHTVQRRAGEQDVVSIPHSLPYGYVDDLVDSHDGLGKGGSTAQVQQELEGLASQCQAISRSIGLLGGVIC